MIEKQKEHRLLLAHMKWWGTAEERKGSVSLLLLEGLCSQIPAILQALMKENKSGGFFASLKVSHIETQYKVCSEGVWEAATKFPWIHQSGLAISSVQWRSHTLIRGSSTVVLLLLKQQKAPFIRNWLELDSVWGSNSQQCFGNCLVMKAEDTPYQACQGRIMPCDAQPSMKPGAGFFCSKSYMNGRRDWKAKSLGVFMETRIMPCCDGSFMNECIMHSKNKV